MRSNETCLASRQTFEDDTILIVDRWNKNISRISTFFKWNDISFFFLIKHFKTRMYDLEQSYVSEISYF